MLTATSFVLFFHNIFIDYWCISHYEPQVTHFPVLLGLLPSHPHQKKKKEKTSRGT